MPKTHSASVGQQCQTLAFLSRNSTGDYISSPAGGPPPNPQLPDGQKLPPPAPAGRGGAGSLPALSQASLTTAHCSGHHTITPDRAGRRGGMGSTVTSRLLHITPRNKALREGRGLSAWRGVQEGRGGQLLPLSQSEFDYPNPAIVKVPHSSGNNNEPGNSLSLPGTTSLTRPCSQREHPHAPDPHPCSLQLPAKVAARWGQPLLPGN